MKTTIKEADLIIEDFEFRLRSLSSSNKSDYIQQFEKEKKLLVSRLKDLQFSDPVLAPYSIGNDWDEIFRSIAAAAEERKNLRWAYAGGYTYQQIQGVRVDMPIFHDLQGSFNVLIKEFDSGDHDRTDDEHSEKVLSRYLLFTLLSFPRGKVRINFSSFASE